MKRYIVEYNRWRSQNDRSHDFGWRVTLDPRGCEGFDTEEEAEMAVRYLDMRASLLVYRVSESTDLPWRNARD
jgi:hypothetical protein